MKISVSFLKSKYDRMTTIKKIENTSCDSIHVDLMDGIFVSEKTQDLESILNLLQNTSKPFNIHLMMSHFSILNILEELSKLHPEYIIIPIEDENVSSLIKKIKSFGIKVGVSINPDTKVEKLDNDKDDFDFILVMGVYPGRGGQTFINKTEERLRIIKTKYPNLVIGVDGGINKDTIKYVKSADMIVSGSYICMSDDYEKQIETLRQ